MNPALNPKRQPVPFTSADGAPCLRVPLASDRGPAIIDADELPALLAHGVTLAWSFNDNGRGRSYVRASRARGNTVTLARLIAGAARRQEVHYRDGDPLNLRRGNLYVSGRPAHYAAVAEGGLKSSPEISAKGSIYNGNREAPRRYPDATTPADEAPRGSAA